MSQEQIQKLIDDRQTLVKNSRDFLEQHEADGLTTDQEAQFTAMHADQEKLSEKITELQAAADRRADMIAQQDAAEKALSQNLTTYADRITAAGGIKTPDGTRQKLGPQEAQALALQGWMLQCNGLEVTDEHRTAAFQTHADLRSKDFSVKLNARAPKWKDIEAAQGTGSTGAGGALVPTGFVPELEQALLAFGGVRELSRIIRTESGNDLEFPSDNDTTNSGVLLAENAADSEADVVFATTTLGAYKYTSKIVRVSIELMQDSALNLPQILGEILGTRLARGQATAITTGTGSSQPQGVVTGSALGTTAAAVAAVTMDELLALQSACDRSYRRNGKWMMHDSTLLAVKKLKDSDGQYLWQPSLQDGAPDRLAGQEVVTNNDMAELATGNKTVIYGDFSKFLIREVRDIILVNMRERYADYHQSAFVALLRFDSKLLDAGTNPIQHLIQA